MKPKINKNYTEYSKSFSVRFNGSAECYTSTHKSLGDLKSWSAPKVNWSCRGNVSIREAKDFAEALRLAIEEAERLEKEIGV